MSIGFLADQIAVDRTQIIAAILCMIFTLIFAAWAGAFRAGSVVGPARLDDSRGQLARAWIIILIAISAGLFVQAIYTAIMHGKELAEMSDADRRLWQPPAIDLIMLSLLVPALSIIAIVIADRKLLTDGPAKIGYAMNRARRGFLIGVAGALVAVPLTIAAATAAQWIWIHFHLATMEEHKLLSVLHEQSSVTLRYLIVFTAIVAAPVFEELLFRGHLQTALARSFRAIFSRDSALPRWLAIVISSLAFASVHYAGAGAGWMLPPLFILAVCFGYVYERTGNLWATIFMHAAFNAVSIGVALLT